MNVFRVANEQSTARHVAATLLQTACFWALFLFVVPAALHALSTGVGIGPWSFPGHRALAVTLFAGGSALGLTSGMVMAVRGRGTPLPMATARELVVAGPYRLVRNPMAVAGIAQGVAVGLWLADVVVVGYALGGAPIWHVFVRPAEERDLEVRFGDAYRRYHAAVPLWLPRRRPWCAAVD